MGVFIYHIFITKELHMKYIITERQSKLLRRVIKEDRESLEIEARIILSRLGYSMTLLKDYTRKELAKTLRQENENRFSSRDKWERLADKLDN